MVYNKTVISIRLKESREDGQSQRSGVRCGIYKCMAYKLETMHVTFLLFELNFPGFYRVYSGSMKTKLR